MKLPAVSGEQVIKALLKAGFSKVRQKGSHVSFIKETTGKVYRTVVPLHKTLAKGTLNDILKQSGLSKEDLIRLLTLIMGI